jgi:ABC-type phosphate transport system permease subunit
VGRSCSPCGWARELTSGRCTFSGAVIANEFAEAADDMHLSALLEVGLVLFVITLIVNMGSRLLIWSMVREKQPRRMATAAIPAEESAA